MNWRYPKTIVGLCTPTTVGIDIYSITEEQSGSEPMLMDVGDGIVTRPGAVCRMSLGSVCTWSDRITGLWFRCWWVSRGGWVI